MESFSCMTESWSQSVLRQVFLQKIHDAHLGVVKSRLLGWTLLYWPNWNHDVETMCQTCETCRENQSMPTNTPKFKVKANHPREIYGVGITDIQGKPHIVCIDYYSCCIFERQLKSLHSTDVIKSLKSIFCDIRAPDKLISDNGRYFVSEEFQEFVMTWSMHYITSSSRFPHGNAHAEKAVHIVKQVYLKADDVKLALLLLKTTPIAIVKQMSPSRMHLLISSLGEKSKLMYPSNIIKCWLIMVKMLLLRCHQSTALIKMFGLSLIPMQSGCQAR